MIVCSKLVEIEEELKVVGANMKALEISEQEVTNSMNINYSNEILIKLIIELI